MASSALTQLIHQQFPRRPDILLDLAQRQVDYDQALEFMEFTSQALAELEKQRAALAMIDPATSGVDPEPKRIRLNRQITSLKEFLDRLAKIEPPSNGYCLAELIRAAEQQ